MGTQTKKSSTIKKRKPLTAATLKRKNSSYIKKVRTLENKLKAATNNGADIFLTGHEIELLKDLCFDRMRHLIDISSEIKNEYKVSSNLKNHSDFQGSIIEKIYSKLNFET